MVIDWTVNLGTILEAMVIAVGGLGFMFSMRDSNKTTREAQIDLRKDLTQVQLEMKEIAEALAIIARQDAQIQSLGHRIDDEREEGKEWRHWVRGEFTKTTAKIDIDIASVHRRIDGLHSAA